MPNGMLDWIGKLIPGITSLVIGFAMIGRGLAIPAIGILSNTVIGWILIIVGALGLLAGLGIKTR